MSSLTRRAFLGASAMGLGGLALGRAGAAFAQAPGSFSYANWSDGPAALASYQEVIDSYLAMTGASIDKQADVAYPDYNTRFRVLLAGGQPPDVMRLNDDYLRELSDKDQLFDLTGYIEESGLEKSEYFESAYDFTQTSKGHMGMTVGISPCVIFYNKTAFLEAGVPLPPSTWSMEGWTWDDFFAAAQALTRGTERYGAQLLLDTGHEQHFSVNNGGEGIFSEDGQSFTLGQGLNLEAMQWLADLSNVHKVQAPWADLQVPNATFDRFINQQDVMRGGIMANYGTFVNGVKDFEWDVAPIPGKVQQKQSGSVTLFMIPAKAKNPKAGFDFLNYMAGPEGGKVFARNSTFIPVNREAATALPTDTGRAMDVFVGGAANHSTAHSTKATSQAVALYRPQLQLAFAGQASVQDALGLVTDQINSLLRA